MEATWLAANCNVMAAALWIVGNCYGKRRQYSQMITQEHVKTRL